MSVFQFPIPRICLALIAGILSAPYLRPDLTLVTIFTSSGILLLFAMVLLKRDRDLLFSATIFSTVFLSGLLTVLVHSPNPEQPIPFSPIKEKTITAFVLERIKPSSFGDRYYLETESVDHQNLRIKLLFYLKNPKKQLTSGTRIAFKSKIKELPRPMNPGQFDYGSYLKNKGVAASTSSESAEILTLNGGKKDIFHWTDKFRNLVRERLEQTSLPPAELAVLQALILGQQQDISRETLQDYQYAGAVHILSVSGLHVGFLMIFLRWVCSCLPRSRTWKFGGLCGTIIALWLFAITAGLSASVVRSVTMFSFLAVALYSNRQQSSFHSLFVSMLLILWCAPSFLYDVGFQLSYLALGFILWLQPLLNSLWRPESRMLKNIRDLASVSIAAQLGTLPLSLYYFHQFPALFLITNLVVVPAVGVIMALGGLCIVWAALAPIPEIIVWPASKGIGLLNQTIGYIASFDSLRMEQLYFPKPFLYLSYLALTLLIWHWQHPNRIKLTLSLLCISGLQLTGLNKIRQMEKDREWIVFHKTAATEWVIREGHKAVFSPKTKQTNQSNIPDYLQTFPNLDIRSGKKSNAFRLADKRILLIDSAGLYPRELPADIVLLTRSPRISLDRLLQHQKPAIIIADGSNFPSDIKRWKASCTKQKIPFHATAEKGFFRLLY